MENFIPGPRTPVCKVIFNFSLLVWKHAANFKADHSEVCLCIYHFRKSTK